MWSNDVVAWPAKTSGRLEMLHDHPECCRSVEDGDHDTCIPTASEHLPRQDSIEQS